MIQLIEKDSLFQTSSLALYPRGLETKYSFLDTSKLNRHLIMFGPIFAQDSFMETISEALHAQRA